MRAQIVLCVVQGIAASLLLFLAQISHDTTTAIVGGVLLICATMDKNKMTSGTRP